MGDVITGRMYCFSREISADSGPVVFAVRREGKWLNLVCYLRDITYYTIGPNMVVYQFS